MIPKKPTHLELVQQRHGPIFIGRREQRQAFRRNFDHETPEYSIFAIYGQAGIGKSFLVGRYQKITQENKGLTALTNEAEATAIKEQSILQAMARLAHQLTQANTPLETFNLRHQDYRQYMQEIESDPNAPPEIFDILGRTAARLAISAAKLTPPGQVVSGILKDTGASVEDTLVKQTGIWTTYLAKRFKNNKEKIALVKEPVKILTPLFVQDLNQRAEKRPVVLCFDTWERTSPHLDQWIRDLLMRHQLSSGVWLIIAGRNHPGLSAEWEQLHPLMACFELKEFTEEETRDFLRQQSITEEARVEQILAFSGGVPVLVSTLASAKGGTAAEAANGLVY